MTDAPSSSAITDLPRTSLSRVAVGLSLVLPMYNERGNVDRTLSSAVTALREAVTEFEIIVVDDGSTDGSAELVTAWQARVPQIRLIRHSVNLGYGAALRSGFAATKQSWVFYTDMDLPCDLRMIRLVMQHINRADVVVGYRDPYGERGWRCFQSRVYNWCCRVLFGVRVRDIGLSYKLIRAVVLERCALRSRTGWIAAELLISAQRSGYRIAEIPVRYQPRVQGVSKMNSPSVISGIAWELICHRLSCGAWSGSPHYGTPRISAPL